MNALFANIVGHKAVCEGLADMIRHGSVPHAFLFSGPEAVGKRTTALTMALNLLGVGCPEGEVPIHRLENHPDFHSVAPEDEKKNIAVSSIRKLSSKLQLKPYMGKCSVALIDNAHEMNLSASNALLKTLEEPTPNSYLFLVTHRAHRLPETILSRCQVMHFGELPEGEIERLISRLFSGIISDPGTLEELKYLAAGSLAPLGLEPFICQRTLSLNDDKKLSSHLSSLQSEVSSIRKRVALLLDGNHRPAAAEAYALSLASEFANNKENSELVWQIIHREIREKLKKTTRKDQVRKAADCLLHSIESQKLVLERNFNPQLHLSSLLAEAGEV